MFKQRKVGCVWFANSGCWLVIELVWRSTMSIHLSICSSWHYWCNMETVFNGLLLTAVYVYACMRVRVNVRETHFHLLTMPTWLLFMLTRSQIIWIQNTFSDIYICVPTSSQLNISGKELTFRTLANMCEMSRKIYAKTPRMPLQMSRLVQTGLSTLFGSLYLDVGVCLTA